MNVYFVKILYWSNEVIVRALKSALQEMRVEEGRMREKESTGNNRKSGTQFPVSLAFSS